ncbi:hypothetical protein DM49_2295 [Burkholderia mallei]|nr:hypothetical protein DO70_2475 [Burkholderia pseudomallei]KGS88418.1 hypothetical protein X976_5657 [Burkholderia pseudomallei MSHR7500]KGW95883.1 hypothetical protein Y030_5273 [Burkholderia pseudomallei MSHR332]KOS95708.1 hypothetical protein DM49_2295 [Burkholderia mallei]
MRAPPRRNDNGRTAVRRAPALSRPRRPTGAGARHAQRDIMFMPTLCMTQSVPTIRIAAVSTV